MNKTPSETKQYLISFLSKYEDYKTDLILALPYTSLSIAKFMIDKREISLGAQNLCDDDEKGCTGEISGKMLADSGVSYVLVGHSERRAKFKEDSKTINKKIKNGLKNRLSIILCVGESLADKNTMKNAFKLSECRLKKRLKVCMKTNLKI